MTKEKKKQSTAVIVKNDEVASFIQQAISQKLPVEVMERLFNLHKDVKAERAKEDFVYALAKFQRDNFTCQYCGRKSPEAILEIDHRFPKSKGGEDNIKNYITSCQECNIGKGDVILKEFKS